MKLLYQSKKWHKEVKELEKYINSMGADILQKRIEEDSLRDKADKDFLWFYFSLGKEYSLYAMNLYLLNVNDIAIVEYIYLSGICILITYYLYDNGIKSGDGENGVVERRSKEYRYLMCFRFLAVDQMPKLILETEADRPIIMLYNRDYDGLRNLLSALPDDPDDSREVYYEETVFLKKIYLAILDKDEKAFNEEIENRIKKYRRNMVGYSTIIDYVSIALIKLAEREGIHCNVDVIEIPKQFFDKELLDNLDIHELSHYDELMKSGMLDRFELD